HTYAIGRRTIPNWPARGGNVHMKRDGDASNQFGIAPFAQRYRRGSCRSARWSPLGVDTTVRLWRTKVNKDPTLQRRFLQGYSLANSPATLGKTNCHRP